MKTIEVLLVEDNAGDALLTGQVIAESPLPVKLHLARDGEEALHTLSNPGFRPDLIILDLNLPKISGHAVLQRRPPNIPVVVFSSSRSESDVRGVMALGACEYIQKPMDIHAFTDAVCGMIERWALRG